MRFKKRVSPSRLYYYVIGFVEALKGGWLPVDPKNNEVLDLNDPRIRDGTTEEADLQEVERYVRVMRERDEKKIE